MLSVCAGYIFLNTATDPLCIVAKTPLGDSVVLLFRENNFNLSYMIYIIFVRQLINMKYYYIFLRK